MHGEQDLLRHPFYQAWSAGTLPIEALQLYADEYGKFISLLPTGWTTLSDEETSQEEYEHAELWELFSNALGDNPNKAGFENSLSLVGTTNKLFSSPARELGALYAFEVQQPATASSKLAGLKEHYQLPKEVEPYFEIHSSNWHESENLLELIAALPSNEQDQVVLACQEMATALWGALSDIQELAS